MKQTTQYMVAPPMRLKRKLHPNNLENSIKRMHKLVKFFKKPASNENSIFDQQRANFYQHIPQKKPSELRFAYINVLHPKHSASPAILNWQAVRDIEKKDIRVLDWATRVKPFVEAIKTIKPDLLALQEITFPNLIELLKTLRATQLFYDYIFLPKYSLRNRSAPTFCYSSIKIPNDKIKHDSESAIRDYLKKFPLDYYTNAFLIAKKANFSLVDLDFYRYDCRYNFSTLFITLRIDDKILVFGNTHYPAMSETTEKRLACAEKDICYLKELNAQKKRFVFGGDLNITFQADNNSEKERAMIKKIYATFTSNINIEDCRYAVDAKNRLGTNCTYICEKNSNYKICCKEDGSFAEYNSFDGGTKTLDLLLSNNALKWFGIFPLFFSLRKNRGNANFHPKLYPIDDNPFDYLNTNSDYSTPYVVSNHFIMVGGIDKATLPFQAIKKELPKACKK